MARWLSYPWPKNPWTRHRQAVWRERAFDTSTPYPLWQRVGMLAFGSHRRNGRAEFAEGELAELLGVKNQRHLANAIKQARDSGWLASESNPLCLIVPSHAVEGGM